MRIQASCNNSFQANINSPKLRFKKDDFFVRIRGYGKDSLWAKITKETADTAVNMARKNTSAENILKYITSGIRKANMLHIFDRHKATNSGILRSERLGWLGDSNWEKFMLCTNYSEISRYKPYQQRLDSVVKNPLTNPYKDIGLTVPVVSNGEHYLKHADAGYVNNAIKRILEIYASFTGKFNSKDIKASELGEVNNDIAEVRWIMAHATPWVRGSDAISNVFMRVMYKSLGIKSYPLKKGVSLDMEAYCTEIEDYKKNFTSYFQQAPEIIK